MYLKPVVPVSSSDSGTISSNSFSRKYIAAASDAKTIRSFSGIIPAFLALSSINSLAESVHIDGTMAEYETQYQALSVYDEDDTGDDTDNHTEADLMIHMVPDSNKARWNHIENLDEFFTRVYQYHQRQGFLCMVLEDSLQLIQFVFVVVFSSFLWKCVDYGKLFASDHKVTIHEAIRSFYLTALKISPEDLTNMTWHEVQTRLLDVQKVQQMCIHKSDLTQLDIYHRILRFKNYTLAMVNKDVLPLKIQLPLVGDYVFLSTGLKYNVEFLLFSFENKWHLRDEYKDNSLHRRKQLAEKLSQRILWLGLANLALSPVIFLWQILYSFFRYAELVKRQPSFLGSRRWLNRGYKAADMYLSIFTSPLMSIIAKNIAFFAGSVLAVLVVLTVIDEDVLNVEHVLTIMTVAGVIVTACKVFIPDEHAVYCPEVLMRNVLAQIHYMPDHWAGNAHTTRVRGEFSLLFQFKAIYLLEELLSPLTTPLMLIFKFRQRASEIVDFFHNFTVEVVGVGDWSECETEASQTEQGEDGKTEMSLMHFHIYLYMYVQYLSICFQYASLVSSITGHSTMLSPSMSAPFASGIAPKLRGAVSQTEGPMMSSMGPGTSFYSPSASLTQPHPSLGVQSPSSLNHPTSISQRHYDEGQIELMSTEMSFSALYMHDLRTRRNRGYPYENMDDIRTRSLWQRHDPAQATPSSGGTTPMPEIVEKPQEEDTGAQEQEL
ncbi:ATG9A-like protein [Mya arenaria]|uniref:Autophagy-related protein 9 n=1 Tax=Mya arenaria TaxID=6604 RepID=A0ABY7D7L8_MYAAR|nr:ATG9A-like protein [Mya arenaria]